MTHNNTHDFENWLRSGGKRIGQLALTAVPDGWELRHADDATRADLATFSKYEDARELANRDDAGAFRPLKTAPNLRHGWRLVLPDAVSVRLALDYFYPGMIGMQLAHERGEARPVELRETLARQTGMYRITQKLTDDQARRLVATQCNHRAGCLKTILWRIDATAVAARVPQEKLHPDETLSDAWPLLCHEACNLWISGARKMVKDETAVPSAP